MTRLRTVLALALMLLLAPAFLAQDKPASPAAIERSHFIYLGEARIGWAKTSLATVEHEGAQVLRETESMYVKITRSLDRQSFVITSETSTDMTVPGMPLRKHEVSVNAGQTITRRAEYKGDTITVTTIVDGAEPRVDNIDAKGKQLGTTYWAWNKLKAEDRLKKGETIEFYRAEMDKLALEKETWSVRGTVSHRKRDGKVVEGMEVSVLSGGNVARLVFDADCMPLVAELPGGFRLDATDAIPKDFQPDPVDIESAMTSRVVVKNYRAMRSAEVLIAFKHDDNEEGVEPLFDTNEYHDVHKYNDAEGEGYGLILKHRKLPADFAAPALPLKDLPAEVKAFTTPTDMCQSDDADLLKEAKRLTEGITDSRKAAEAIMNYVYTHLTKASGDTGMASARQAWEEKKGDCTEHAVLFVALARAAGLPARNISGIMYLSEGSSAMFGYHAWSEVWLGQWVPVDATINELGSSARYIMFSIDEPGQMRGRGRIARCLGQKIKPELAAYELEDGKTWRSRNARQIKPAPKPE